MIIKARTAIELATARVIDVYQSDNEPNTWGFDGDMWWFDGQGNPYHEDELKFID